MDTVPRRPVGQVVSNSELETMIPKMQQQAYEARLVPEIHWLVARCMLSGFLNPEPNFETRKVLYNAHNPRGSTRVDIPELINRMRREQGRLLSTMREPTTAPVMTGNADIYRTNRFAKGAVSWIYHKTKFAAKQSQLIAHMLLDGTAGLFPFWMSHPEPQPDGEDGDVRMRIVPAWQIYPYPATALEDESVQIMIWGRPASEEWVKNNFPDATGEKTTIFATPNDVVSGKPDRNSTMEGYFIRQCFIRPSRRFPQGDHFWMVGDKVYKREGQLNFKVGHTRTIPISVCRWMDLPTSYFGESFGYQVTRLNKEINRQMSLLVRRAIMKAHPGYLMVPLGACDTEMFKQQIGGVVPYRPSLINPESTKPFWMTYPPGTSDTDIVVNRLDGYMQDITSQHEASEGSLSRADSAKGMQAVIRQDAIPSESTTLSVDQCVQSAFGLALQIGRDRWKTPKNAVITGPAGMIRIPIVVNPREIPELDMIRIVTSLDLPLDRQAMLQFVMNLSVPASSNAMPILTGQELRRSLQAMGVSIPGVDLIDPNEETAWRENLMIYNDGITPGMVDEPSELLENLQTHLDVHRLFAATMEIHSAPEAIRTALSQHIALTSQLMGGPAMANGFDADLERSDSEQLTEEIEAASMGARLQAPAAQGGTIPIAELLSRLSAAANQGQMQIPA